MLRKQKHEGVLMPGPNKPTRAPTDPDPHKPPEPMRPDPTREPIPPPDEQPEPKIEPPGGSSEAPPKWVVFIHAHTAPPPEAPNL